MLDFQPPSSKGEEGESKRKRFHLLIMLLAFLVLSWRLILIFQNDNMMWWILTEHIVPCLWIGHSTHWMFLGPIWYVLACSILCPYFFLAYWMTHDLVDLCFKLMWILWRKVCEWLEASNRWLVLSLPNMCSMRWAGYAMMLSKCLLLGLFLMMELTLDFTDFSSTLNESCWFRQKDFGGKDQEPWTWEPSVWSLILHKSRGKYWRWLL